jgi:hypothetical protein
MHFGPFAMVGRTRESCYVLIVVLRVEVGRRLNLWLMIFWVMPQSSSQVTSKHSKLLAPPPLVSLCPSSPHFNNKKECTSILKSAHE